jgi:predicted Rdx family selenoprotein
MTAPTEEVPVTICKQCGCLIAAGWTHVCPADNLRDLTELCKRIVGALDEMAAGPPRVQP